MEQKRPNEICFKLRRKRNIQCWNNVSQTRTSLGIWLNLRQGFVLIFWQDCARPLELHKKYKPNLNRIWNFTREGIFTLPLKIKQKQRHDFPSFLYILIYLFCRFLYCFQQCNTTQVMSVIQKYIKTCAIQSVFAFWI